MRALVLLVLASACGFAPRAVTGDSTMGGDDAPRDVMPGSEPPPNCYGNGLGVAVCLVAPPTSKYEVLVTAHVVTDVGSPD